MAGNTFGTLFRVTTAGVSHGPGYLCVIDGCPAGLELSVADLLPDLARRRRAEQTHHPARRDRRPGNLVRVSRAGPTARRSACCSATPTSAAATTATSRTSTGRPRRLHVRRQVRVPRLPRRRPQQRPRDGLPVAAGAVAKKLLARAGIRVLATSPGSGREPPTYRTRPRSRSNKWRRTRSGGPVPDAARRMEEVDRRGPQGSGFDRGRVRVGGGRVPPGLGEPVFDKLKATSARRCVAAAVLGSSTGPGSPPPGCAEREQRVFRPPT